MECFLRDRVVGSIKFCYFIKCQHPLHLNMGWSIWVIFSLNSNGINLQYDTKIYKVIIAKNQLTCYNDHTYVCQKIKNLREEKYAKIFWNM